MAGLVKMETRNDDKIGIIYLLAPALTTVRV